MKIRNVFFPMIVALAVAAPVAHATDAAAYKREAAALENKLDVIQDGMNALGDRPVTQETAQKLQLQLAVLQARHDLALGKLLATASKAAPASAAYSAYESDVARLENKLDVIRDGVETLGDRPVTQETAQKLQLQLAYLKARHDLALGDYLAAPKQ